MSLTLPCLLAFRPAYLCFTHVPRKHGHHVPRKHGQRDFTLKHDYSIQKPISTCIWIQVCCSSRTVMIATISSSPSQYHHTVNTLKYANRAKEIKTQARRNEGTVQEHVSKLCIQIAALQRENANLKLGRHNTEAKLPTTGICKLPKTLLKLH